MTPDTDPTEAVDPRRRKGKPTTIDLTATPASTPVDAAQSEPASGPTPAPASEDAPAGDPAPAASGDSEAEALAVAEASKPDEAPAAEPASTDTPVSEPDLKDTAATSDVTGERFTAPTPPQTPPPAAEPAPEHRRGGGFGLVAAAIVGGLIGVGGRRFSSPTGSCSRRPRRAL